MLRVVAGGTSIGIDLFDSLLSAGAGQFELACVASTLLSLATACCWASHCSQCWFEGFTQPSGDIAGRSVALEQIRVPSCEDLAVSIHAIGILVELSGMVCSGPC